MKAIVVTDPTAGTAGMTLTERPDPAPGGNDVLVEVHASGFTPGELSWPGTWVDHLGRDRTPSIPGHEVAGIVRSLGYGTRGLSVGQRVFGLAAWELVFGDKLIAAQLLTYADRFAFSRMFPSFDWGWATSLAQPADLPPRTQTELREDAHNLLTQLSKNSLVR